MPPHCDSLDGPVVTAARAALEEGRVELVLPYVHAPAEAEVRKAFDRTVAARSAGAEARAVADEWFFETVVRLHRAGEGAPFTGLKPAGLDVGPVIPAAEHAFATGDPTEVVTLLVDAVRDEALARFHHALHLREHADRSVADARAHVEAVLGFEVWAHHLVEQVHAPAHGEGHGAGHAHEHAA